MYKQEQLDNYGYDQSGDRQPNATVVQMSTVSTEAPIDHGLCNIVTAVIGWFCCAICGFPATVCALIAYVDMRNKEYGRAQSRIRCAYGCGITAIVLGSVMTVAVIIVLATTAVLGNAMSSFHPEEEVNQVPWQ